MQNTLAQWWWLKAVFYGLAAGPGPNRMVACRSNIYILIYNPRHKHTLESTYIPKYMNLLSTFIYEWWYHKPFRENQQPMVSNEVDLVWQKLGGLCGLDFRFFIFYLRCLVVPYSAMCPPQTHSNRLLSSYVYNDNFDILCHGFMWECVCVYYEYVSPNSRKWWK